MTRLYLTPLPKRTTDTASGQTGSQVQQAGLLDTGGTSVENIATENVDFRKQGRIQLGPTLSRKVADELDSLSESAYTSLPLFDPSGSSLGRKAGYYEVTRADVTPAQEARDDVYQYDVQLTKAGTREDSRRAVRTNPETILTGLATGSPAPVGIPAEAINPRWYDEGSGTEDATPTNTVTTQYGDVDLFDYTNATASAPELIYDLPFDRDGPADVRVYDDLNQSKLATTASGGEVSRWIHAYHTGYQFEGGAVIDNGRIRFRLGSDITAEEYDTTNDVWNSVSLTSGDLSLDEWSLQRIGPANVRIRLISTDTLDGSTQIARARVERGLGGILLQEPLNGSLSPKYESWLSPIASNAVEDPQPEQG